MLSAIAIDIAAPPDLVFALARDVERWPRLLPHYVRARRLRALPDGSLVIEFVARRPLVPALGLGLPVAWRSRTWAEPANRRLRFVHSGGATDGMDVTWRIEDTGAGSHVTIEHEFERDVPVPGLGTRAGADAWPALIDRFFTRPIAGRTLATFKALAEAITTAPVANESADESAGGSADESAAPPRTNH